MTVLELLPSAVPLPFNFSEDAAIAATSHSEDDRDPAEPAIDRAPACEDELCLARIRAIKSSAWRRYVDDEVLGFDL